MNGRNGVAALAAAAAALVAAVPGLGAPPATGTGTGTTTSRVILSSRTADGNIIQERENRGTVSGTLTGTFVEEVRGVIHASGLVTFAGVMTFTGTVDGCGSGTLTLAFSGQGVVGAPVTESAVRIVGAGESTLRAQGEGTVDEVGPTFTYSVQLRC
jgi:hypothetical protein